MAVKKNALRSILAKIDAQFENDVEFIVERIASQHGEEDPPTHKTTLRECPLLLGKGPVSKAVASSIMAGNKFTSGKTAEALGKLIEAPDEERYWHFAQGQLMVYQWVYQAAELFDKASDVDCWYDLICVD
jgi:hypothetical protein